MKLSINKSAKRVLSIAIAFAMLIGTMFVANVGVTINANAATETEGKTVYLNDATLTDASKITGLSLSSFTKDGEYYIIDTVEKLAYVCVRSFDAAGLKFKVADDIDAFVLQTESYASGIKNLSDYSEVKEYFEENTQNRFNWARDINTNGFRGYFDGNGVKIYGMYANGCLNDNAQPALFPLVDGGASDGTSFEFTYSGSTVKASTSATGTTIKNLEILNSYAKGWRRVGILIGCDNWTEGGYKVEGFITINNIVMGNCYVECVDNYTNSSGTAKTNSRAAGEAGLFAGSIGGNDYVNVSNILAYGSYGCYKLNETDEEATSLLYFAKITYKLTSDGGHTGDVYSTFHDAIIFGDNLYQLTTHKPVEYTYNVYTNSDAIKGTFEGVTKLFDEKTLYGAPAMAWAPALNWGTDWFAVEGQYPTPIEPDSYIPVSEKPTSLFESGDGSKESPYIIRTTDQLYQMVNGQSYSDTYTETFYDYSTPADKSITSYYSKYYKVADGVKALYINDVETQAEVKALAESGACNKWAPTQSVFAGNFDGNGVTIYGMVSTTGKGFVNKIDGTHAAIKNVHFKAAYVKGSGVRAAVVTTDFGVYGIGYKATEDATGTTYYNREYDPNGEEVNDFLIANIAVTESYIETTLTGGDNNVATAGGIVTISTTPQWLTVKNCLFDGVSSTIVDGTGTTAGVNPDSMKAGIASITAAGTTNRWEFANCVSINEYPVSMKTGATYTRLTENSGGGSCEISTMYGPANSAIDLTAYPKFGAIIALETKDVYTVSDALLLDWASTWDIVEVSEGREIPMPTGIASENAASSFSQMIAEYRGYTGANNGSGVKGNNGKYGWQYTLTGSGTEEDPYLITNALQLAQAIACGGKQYQHKLYYKLACNIDLSGYTWIDQTDIGTNYIYVPFEGTLDGDGHVITGLSAVDKTAAGLIPVLNGGTVKDLHVRDSYAGSMSAASAGLIAGVVNSGSTIANCSVEGSDAVNSEATIIGNWTSASSCVTNSYIVVDGVQTFTSDADTSKLYPAADAVWYKGTDGIYRHISFAKGSSIFDVDADGIINTTYTVNDVITLRKNLLDETGYLNIYGDVNNDGTTNISDLVTIRRDMVGSRNDIRDGFWRSVELGKVSIYYAENDTYDMARKIELYLETLSPSTDINKVAGTAVTDTSIATKADYANQQNAVVITQGTPANDTYDDYSITYDEANNVLTFYGGSFTAVEQAVVEFIANADPKSVNSEVYTTNGTKSILTLTDTTKDATSTTNHYLSYKTVEDMDGNTHTVYYAWGDEFEGTGIYDTDVWEIRNYRNEGSLGEEVKPTSDESVVGDTRYLNLEGATTDSIKDLWEVNDGKLRVWRGVSVGEDFELGIYDTATQNAYNNGTYTWGYKAVEQNAYETNSFGRYIDENDIFVDPGIIQTSRTMMFKQGYAEMRAALPHDGHAFPAWWFMTGAGQKNTNAFENHYLWSKVYKLNSNWDGTTMTTDPTDLTTYKYQLPQAFLECDIVEFMQAQGGVSGSAYNWKGTSTGDYRDYIQLTIHKYYNQHVKDGMLYVPNWSTGGYVSGYNGISQADFKTTSSDGDNATFIHRFDPDATTSAHPYTVTTGSWFWEDETSTSASYSIAQAIKNGAISNSSARPNDIYTYGFWWSVDEAAGTYDLVVYVDFNNDGNMAKSEMIFHINETNGHEYNDPTWGNTSASKGSDAAVWNQYAYMLIDNAFYTSNPYGTSSKYSSSSSNESGVTMFTDLLTQDNTWETTTFDLEYVRVYQEDGRRDLITPETEAFNTGNHFGY